MYCSKLIGIQKKIYKNRKKIFKKDRKLKRKTYLKRMKVISMNLTTSENLFLRFFLKKSKIDRRISVKNILIYIFRFDCNNIVFREHYSRLKLFSAYEKLSNRSKFSFDPQVLLDDIILTMIKG